MAAAMGSGVGSQPIGAYYTSPCTSSSTRTRSFLSGNINRAGLHTHHAHVLASTSVLANTYNTPGEFQITLVRRTRKDVHVPVIYYPGTDFALLYM